jgi:hypothetical protein
MLNNKATADKQCREVASWCSSLKLFLLRYRGPKRARNVVQVVECLPSKHQVQVLVLPKRKREPKKVFSASSWILTVQRSHQLISSSQKGTGTGT